MQNSIEIINKIFGVDLKQNQYEKNIECVLEWDSFMVMNFMAEMEEVYKINVSIYDISNITKVKHLVELVDNLIINKEGDK